MKKFDSMRLLEDDGKIVVRLYCKQQVLDGEIDLLTLGLVIKDAAAIHCHAVARALNKDLAA